MKKILCLVVLCLLFGINQANAGILWTDTIVPIIATDMKTDNVKNLKCGQCQFTQGLFISTGHAGIQDCSRRSGITQIHHVDLKRKYFLGIFGMSTIQVYGE